MSRAISLWVVLPLLLLPALAPAHDLSLARVEIAWGTAGRYTIDAELPETLEVNSPQVPAHCSQVDDIVRPAGGIGLVQRSWYYECDAAQSGPDDVIVLAWPLEGVFVESRSMGDGIADGRFFDADEETIVIVLADVLSASGERPSGFAQYFVFGLEHILTGWDHLAFVLALCLIAAGWRLIKLVTAFTVGHSITLALGALGWVQVPAPPLEASIALSIAFVAREALLGRDDEHGYFLVTAFGLLHGLGFAGALGEAGFTEGGLVSALLAFNLGVEVGQIMFVLAVVSAALLLRQVMNPYALRPAIAWGAGTLGLFWTLERTAYFFQ